MIKKGSLTMHEYIRVTSGHSLDSDLRYREETLHMVLIDPYPVDYEGPRDYRCTRLFLTDEAYSLIERMAYRGDLRIRYSTLVINGEIID